MRSTQSTHYITPKNITLHHITSRHGMLHLMTVRYITFPFTLHHIHANISYVTCNTSRTSHAQVSYSTYIAHITHKPDVHYTHCKQYIPYLQHILDIQYIHCTQYIRYVQWHYITLHNSTLLYTTLHCTRSLHTTSRHTTGRYIIVTDIHLEHKVFSKIFFIHSEHHFAGRNFTLNCSKCNASNMFLVSHFEQYRNISENMLYFQHMF